jgi:hypothetical protein
MCFRNDSLSSLTIRRWFSVERKKRNKRLILETATTKAAYRASCSRMELFAAMETNGCGKLSFAPP